MKKILIGVLAVALYSCQTSEPVDYAILSGKITNVANDSARVSTNLNKLVKKIPIKKDGSFLDTIYNPTGYYSFSDGNEHTAMYLANGNNIHLTLDTEEFDETLTYTGKGSAENNYLAKKYLLDEQLGNPRDLYALDEEIFLKKIDSFTIEVKKLLDNPEISDVFKNKELKNLEYEYVLKLQPYERYHAGLSKNKDFKVSENFPKLMENVVFDDVNAFSNSTAYQQLTYKSVFMKAMDIAKKDSIPFQKAAINEIKQVDNVIIKNALLEQLSSQVSLRNDKAKDLYKNIMALSTDENFKNRLTKKFESFSKLKKGIESPVFTNYENYDGSKSSLTDYKGKYVYIDVWATWCAPCRAEIPFLKELNTKYKNKDIVFISISIDTKRAHEAWKKMIEEKQMDGVQLFANNDWKSEFIQSYGISSIPRFILIDKEGKIVNPNAPRPSNPQLIELFNQLGIR